MRVSVTISDDMNLYFTDLAKEKGVSKDKVIGSILIEHMKHNPRGAGRKRLFGEVDAFKMRELKVQGLSYRDIAKKYDCSVGLVHKLINEQF